MGRRKARRGTLIQRAMTLHRNTLRQNENGNDSQGLSAIGSAGGWEVAIDKTTSGTQRWFAQIEGPSVYLYFEIAAPDVIDEILDFLTERRKARNGSRGISRRTNGELLIGKSKDEPVTIVR